MADETHPRRDPSQTPDDDAHTEPVDNPEPAQSVPEDPVVDPETRMVEELAALRGGDQHDEDTATQAAAPVESAEAPAGAESEAPASEPIAAEQPTEATDPIADAKATNLDSTAVLAAVPAEKVAPSGSGAGEPPNPGKRSRKKKRRWPWGVLVAVLLLGGGYVATAFVTQDTLPATLTVQGVDVSGQSVPEATDTLQEALTTRAERDITVHVAEHEAIFVPAEAGYDFDVAATLEGLTELTFDPVALWSRIFGEAHVDAVQNIDAEASSEAMAGLAEQLTFDPTEGSVAYAEAAVDYTPPVDGFTVDSDALERELANIWLDEAAELTAPGDVTDPVVSAGQWENFVDQIAQPLVDGPYTVAADSMSAELSAAQLAAAAEVRVEAVPQDDEAADESAETPDGEAAEANAQQASATVPAEPAEQDEQAEQSEPTEEDSGTDRPVLRLDGEKLAASLEQNDPAFASTNKDASVRLAGSAGSARPEVVPGSVGRGVNEEDLVAKIMADLEGDQTRSVTVELHEVQPNVTTEDAEAWDVTHAVVEYATPYPPHDGPRTANLRVGADRINGTVVMPGEEFNLNAILSPITAANGYHSSGVVESGVSSTAMGGGLSQIATMSYNAGFLGGMEIVEHKPHSRWFDRYPKGRESTYWEGQVNVRWKNDTNAPVIVEMWLADSQVKTRLWGSDYYDVSTTTSAPYNYTASPTIRNSRNDCIPERGGRQGFTVDVHRTKTPPSGESIQETWRWAYTGWPKVICE